jgi:hypothetical protein
MHANSVTRHDRRPLEWRRCHTDKVPYLPREGYLDVLRPVILLVLRILVFLTGVLIVSRTALSALTTFVLPRGVPDRLTGIVFTISRYIFDLRALRVRDYGSRDRIMALYAPATLLTLPAVWLALVMIGYACMFWSLGISHPSQAITTSGSSLLTLGFAPVHNLAQTLLAFTEAGLGLSLAALLIAYLPTMYGAWSRREALVATMETRAGTPPSVANLIIRYNRLNRLDRIADLWVPWEAWFTDIEESHTSLAPLTFFRSPQPDRSWITAAGVVLDTASFYVSTLDVQRDVQAELLIRTGYIALRRIADVFTIPYDIDPNKADAISISREEFNEVVARLQAEGIPLKPDLHQAWLDFAGWRVNYDTVLLALARLTMAPYAPWISDRSLRSWRDGHWRF